MRLVFDMETSDPDDVLTLCVLATHPWVHLAAVTVHPGGEDQVGLVKHILRRLDRLDVPVGAGKPKKMAPRVSAFHYRWLGQVGGALPDGPADAVMISAVKNGATHLLTGAALTNVYDAYMARKGKPFFGAWTCQGGFAGDSVVLAEDRLPKFEGRETCPTFNLNGDRRAAQVLVDEAPISVKRFVSKNVCHGIIYDRAMHDRIPSGAHAGLDMLKEGMEVYFQGHPEGKALHDTVAAALAIDASAARWAQGTLYYSRGEWGFRMYSRGTHLITVALNVSKFEAILAGTP